MEDSRSEDIINHLEEVIKHFLVCFLKVAEHNIESFFDRVITKYLG